MIPLVLRVAHKIWTNPKPKCYCSVPVMLPVSLDPILYLFPSCAFSHICMTHFTKLVQMLLGKNKGPFSCCCSLLWKKRTIVSLSQRVVFTVGKLLGIGQSSRGLERPACWSARCLDCPVRCLAALSVLTLVGGEMLTGTHLFYLLFIFV